MEVSPRDQMTALVPGIGPAGIAALKRSRVLVVGAGGLGSPVLFYLAAAGVGTIAISDPDRLEVSNLQRQVIHPAKRVGEVKSESAARTLRSINPEITVLSVPKLEAENGLELVKAYDLIIDASDNFATKYLLSDLCKTAKRPLIWGTLVSMQFQVSVFTDGITLRDLYPEIPPPGTTVTSKQIGVLGAVCGQAGSIMATEAIKWITKTGTPLKGKVLIADAAVGSWEVVSFKGKG